MSYLMIDTQAAVKHFHALMQSSDRMKVLRLVGEANMGKSHVLTHVFPFLAAQQYQARTVCLDLRNDTHTVSDVLDMVYSLLHGQCSASAFTCYETAYEAWQNRPKSVVFEKLIALFSSVSVSMKDAPYDLHQHELHLTRQMVKDLTRQNDRPLLLLFDTVDQASKSMQTWLMDMLLVQLSLLSHVRVVMAGRSLPEASSSYSSCCQSHQLCAVTDVEDYIAYCRAVNCSLVEESIRVLSLASNFTPGLFVQGVKYIQLHEGVRR